MKLSIRLKLLLGFVALLTLSSLVVGFAFVLVSDHIATQTAAIHHEKAQQAAAEIADFFGDMEAHGIGLSRAFSKYLNDPSQQNRQNLTTLVSYTIENNDFIDKIVFLDSLGTELIGFNRAREIPDEELANGVHGPYFLSAASGNAVVSKVYFNSKTLSPQVEVFMPIWSGPKTLAVIKMELSLERLWSFIDQVRLGETGFAYVVDNSGTLIAHPDQELVGKQPNVSERAFILPLANNSPRAPQARDYLYTNEQDVDVVARASFVPLLAGGVERPLGWLAVFEQSKIETFAFLDFIRLLLFLAAGASFILLSFIAVFLSSNLTHPLKVLQEATERLQQGKLDTRIVVKSGDEVERLANSFNSMASRIRKSILALRRDREVISAERNKLQVALAGITDAVVGLDLEKRIVLFNPAFERLAAFQRDELIGKNAFDIFKVYARDREVKVSEYCPVKPPRYEGICYSEQGLRFESGKKENFVNMSAGQIKEGRNVGLGCIVMLHDITEERRFAQLKTEFVTVTAHRLRTPLSVIKWTISMLLEGEAGKITAKQKNLLTKSYIGNQRMIALVDDLLNASQFEREQYAYKFSVGDMRQIIESVVNMESLNIKKEGLRLTLNAGGASLPRVAMDVGAIQLVVENLLENAVRYTPTGGAITISLSQVKESLQVAVHDTGVGIPKGEQREIFQKFFRANNAMRMHTEGSGLGLFMVKKIVENHGGTVWFESEEGKGSTFFFTLPIKEKKKSSPSFLP